MSWGCQKYVCDHSMGLFDTNCMRLLRLKFQLSFNMKTRKFQTHMFLDLLVFLWINSLGCIKTKEWVDRGSKGINGFGVLGGPYWNGYMCASKISFWIWMCLNFNAIMNALEC
jgi:hypothetical protein